MSKTIAVISAGIGTPSTTRLLADRIGDAVFSRVTARGEAADLVQIELRELVTDLATMMSSGIVSPALEAAHASIAAADGIIAVTPVFTASYSGLFKMFFDTLDKDAIADTPVLIAATAGTARHSLVIDHALRPLFVYLRADVVPVGVFAATDDFAGEEDLRVRVGRAADQLAARVVAQRLGVDGFTASPQGDADVRASVGFASLLKGHTGRR